nr:replication protein [Belladonna mottle virus]
MSFQSALEALNSTTHRDAVSHPILTSVVRPLQDSLETYPWLLPKEALPFLNSQGIPASSFGTTPHPHPIHKTLETFLLHQHWSFLCVTPSTVLFMKPSKFQKLQRKNPNFQELKNYRLTSSDTVRYPTTSLTLPDTESVFMQDALMYFHPSQICDLFLKSPNVQKLFCSLVIPPESSFTDLSLHPEIYTYQISGQTLHYVPENHSSGSYNQPLSALSWLKIHSIVSTHTTLSVTILDSWGPLHSILIQRGLPSRHPARASQSIISSNSDLFNQFQLVPTALASFRIPEALELPSASFLNQPLRHRLVPVQVYNSLFTYTRAVRTLRTSDPAGFVRTQSNKPQYSWVTPSAWDNLQTFALLNANVRQKTRYLFLDNPLQKITHYLKQHSMLIFSRSAPLISALLLLPKLLSCRLPVPVISKLSIAGRSLVREPPALTIPVLQLAAFPHILQRKSFTLPRPLIQVLEFLGIPLHPKDPLLPRLRFKQGSLPLPSWKFMLALGLLPEAVFAFLHITQPTQDQSYHDLYHHNLHPQQFRLQWELTSFLVDEIHPFLPLNLESSDSPSSTPLLQAPPSFEQVASLLPDSTEPSPPAPAPPTEPLPPSPPVSLTFGSLPFASTVHPDGSLTMHEQVVQPRSPSPDPPQSSLLNDPTCSGPVLPFEELFPASYLHETPSFQTRLRVHPSSHLPIPSKRCLLTALSESSSYSVDQLWNFLQEILPDSLLSNPEVDQFGLSSDILIALSYHLHFQVHILSASGWLYFGIANASTCYYLKHESGPPAHYSCYRRIVGGAPRVANTDRSTNYGRLMLRFKYNDCYLPFKRIHKFSPSLSHAKNLISNMKNGFDGILSSIDTPSSSSGPSPRERIYALDSICDVARTRFIDLVHIAGFPGCGKTHPLQQLLKTRAFSNFRISCPTTELRNEWKADMKPNPEDYWKFSTWESSLLKKGPILVIDEIYKLPRGYLDLSIIADPSIQFVVILGDPLQGEYHSSSPHSSNSRLQSEVHRLSRFIDCYCWWSYRIPKQIARLFNVQTFNSEEGFISTISSHRPNGKNLVNSIPTADTMHQLGHHALTISSSQGMTFEGPVSILLDRHTVLLSCSNTFVALTRSKKGVEFLGNLSMASGTFGNNYMFSAALAHHEVNLSQCFPRLFDSLPKIYEPIKSRRVRLTGGETSQEDIARLESRAKPPHISVDDDRDVINHGSSLLSPHEERRLDVLHLPPTRLVLQTDLISAVPSEASPSLCDSIFSTPFTPSYPEETFENLAAFFLPAHDPSLKEMLYRDESSSQFPYLDSPFHLSCQPSSLISAIHRPASDSTLLPLSINKRLKFRPSASPYSFTPNDFILGEHLYQSLCTVYNRHPSDSIPFDPVLFAECICINDYAQLSSKTKATIVANAERSDPDWRYTSVKIFAKSQHKVNDGSIFGNWKACQTLALMHDYVILTLGPVKKYQRFFDQKDCPSHVYKHCGKTPADLSNWCKSHLSHQLYIENDYTSFDQSQHGEAVVLEVLKMRRLNIPNELIDLHVHLKTNVDTQFGPLTCMRLTGEPGTYDDNTDYNLAVIYSQYSMGSTPCLVSGDDSVIAGQPPANPSWNDIKNLLHLKFKTHFSPYPLFCGYYVAPIGAVRNPYALFAKLMIAIDDGTIPEKKLSYLSEFSIGHSVGHEFWSALPDSIHCYQSAVYNYFCRNCSRSEKLLLTLDSIDESHLEKLSYKVKWVSKTLFSMLPQKARDHFISASKISSFPDDPSVSSLESELLHGFQ